MVTSGNFREIKLEAGGPIDPKDVSKFFSTIGKLNKKKIVKWEQEQRKLMPDELAEEMVGHGFIEMFVEALFKWENEIRYLRRDDTTYLEVFFNNIHLIRQSNIFWRIAPLFWDVGGSYDERWLAVFKKHQRAENLNYRSTCFRNISKHKYPEGHKGYISSKTIDSYEENYFNRIGINDDVKLYRAFRVRHNKPVRKGVRKVDNPYAHLQEEGKGISFTLSKIIATGFLNQQWNSFYYKTYLGIEDIDEMKKILQETLDESMSVGMLLQENVYSCIGTFSVKKKDIIASNLYNGEEEVLVDPKDAKLLRYEFINFFDACAVSAINRIIFSHQRIIEEGNEIKTKLWYHQQPETKMLRVVSKLYKEYLDDKAKRRILLDKENNDDKKYVANVIQPKLNKAMGGALTLIT